jgi:hydrogenase-4 membrane subunit HyfE
MTGVLLAFMIVALVPLFVATWRTSLLGLALQGGFIAWLALRHGVTLSLDSSLTLVDAIGLRAILGPAVLYAAMRGLGAPPRNNVIAPNLFSWAIALGLVVAAFRSADVLFPVEGEEQMLVAVSSSGLVLGMFVLSTAQGTFSQIVGLFRIENAIALFELGGPRHSGGSGIRAGMTLVLLLSIGFYRWYLVHVPRDEDTEPELATETEVL